MVRKLKEKEIKGWLDTVARRGSATGASNEEARRDGHEDKRHEGNAATEEAANPIIKVCLAQCSDHTNEGAHRKELDHLRGKSRKAKEGRRKTGHTLLASMASKILPTKNCGSKKKYDRNAH